MVSISSFGTGSNKFFFRKFSSFKFPSLKIRSPQFPFPLGLLANEVLKRARQSGNASQPADWKSGLSKEQVREKIYFERIFEGAGEPEMYQKMRLRGTELLKKAFEVNNGHGIIQISIIKNTFSPVPVPFRIIGH